LTLKLKYLIILERIDGLLYCLSLKSSRKRIDKDKGFFFGNKGIFLDGFEQKKSFFLIL